MSLLILMMIAVQCNLTKIHSSMAAVAYYDHQRDWHVDDEGIVLLKGIYTAYSG